MTISLSLDSLPEGERLEAWRHAASNSIIPHEMTVPWERAIVGATLWSRDVGMVVTTSIRGGFDAIRSRRHISNSKGEFLIVRLQIKGSTVEQHCGEEVALRPGDISFRLSTSPYHIYHPPGGLSELITLRVPISAASLPGSVLQNIAGHKVASTQRIGRVLSSLMLTLHDDEQGPSAAVDESLGLVVVELTRAAIVDHLEVGRDKRVVGRVSLRRLIVGFIDENLADPDLSPEWIAAEHHISVRLLHRVFAEAGTTIGAYVRNRRLRAAAHELAKCELPNRTIDSIARRCGFSSHAHFTRAFKAAYGRSPKEWRSAR